jgi:hypothetical protein
MPPEIAAVPPTVPVFSMTSTAEPALGGNGNRGHAARSGADADDVVIACEGRLSARRHHRRGASFVAIGCRAPFRSARELTFDDVKD